MKICLKSGIRRGMTLVEVALAMGLGMIVATMLLALFNQQVAFLQIFTAQSFITEEAPMISMYVGRMTGKADRFRLHASKSDALSGSNPRLSASPVMLMNFRQPDGTVRSSILAFEKRNGKDELNYYLVPNSPSPSLGTPQWSITRKASDVSFTVQDGVLRMRLTGTNQEQITYSGTMQQ